MKKPKPTIIAIPNTTKEKMEAIVKLSQAVLELSRALSATNVEVVISHNRFDHAPLNIKTE